MTALVLWVGWAQPAAAAPPHPTHEDCPLTRDQWLTWRDLTLQKAAAARFTSGWVEIYGKLRRCQVSLSEAWGPEEKCFQRLANFAANDYRSHSQGHTLGLDILDNEYLRRMHNEGFGLLPSDFLAPDLLKLSQMNGAEQQIVERVERIGKHYGYDVLAFPYVSRHLESPDAAGTRGRVFVRIKAPDFEIFAQYAVGSVDGSKPSGISVITIDKGRGGRKLDPPIAYFNDLMRKEQPGGEIKVVDRLSMTSQVEPCYNCHKSALVPIVPDDGFDFQRFGLRLSQANEEMSHYATARQIGFDADSIGPGLGIPPPVKADRLVHCAGRTLNSKEIQELALLVQCGTCHDGSQRPKLTYPSGLSHQLPRGRGNLAERFFTDYAIMPPGLDSLDGSTRNIAWRCVKEDLYGDGGGQEGRLVAWLKDKRCFISR